MRPPEPTTVGITDRANRMLVEMTEDSGEFKQKLDGYRFAIALAISAGGISNTLTNSRTIYAVGSLDPEKVIYNTAKVLLGDLYPDQPIYKIVERLAEWGIQEMYASRVDGYLDLDALLPE